MTDLAPPRRALRLRAGLLIGAVAVVALVAALSWPRSSVVGVQRQPSSVTYSDNTTHYAVIRHVTAPISALRLSGDASSATDHYELVLGSDPGGGYGHYVRLDAGTGSGVGELTVDWAQDGATVTYGSGHRLFVPSNLFTGGR